MDLRDKGTRRGITGREPDDGSGITGSHEQRAIRLSQDRKDLPGIEFRDGGRVVAVLANLEELALWPGADDQPVVDPGQRMNERFEPQDLTRNSVGVETINGVFPRGDWPGSGRAALGRPARRGPRSAGGGGRILKPRGLQVVIAPPGRQHAAVAI